MRDRMRESNAQGAYRSAFERGPGPKAHQAQKLTETELLLLCARPEAAAVAPRIRELLLGPVDWAYLLLATHRHGLMPLLYDRLVEAGPELVPDEILDQLRERFEANWRRTLVQLEETAAVLDMVRGQGIDGLVLRSPLFALELYENSGLREQEPIEVLVRPNEVERVRTLLYERGFEPVYALTPARERALQHARCSVLRHAARGLRLHLYDRLVPSYFPVSISFDRLWSERSAVSIGNRRIRALGIEDKLLAVCLHGGSQVWGKMAWLADLGRLLHKGPDIDWPLLFERSREAHAERCLALGLYLCRRLLGSSLPAEAEQYSESDAEAVRLGEQVERRLFLDLRGRTGEAERLRFRLALLKTRRDRLRYSLRFATSPTVEDWKAVTLPDEAFGLYRLVRPGRLALTLASPLLRRVSRAPYFQTPMPVVQRMLTMAEVGPEDVVYDLGCGDGRIVICAAREHGARGIGIDLDPQRIAESRSNARREGVEHLVSFFQGDVLEADIRPATVVTIWTLPEINLRLRPRLQSEMRQGGRVVGHSFDMGDWLPDKTEIVSYGDDDAAIVYLWTVRASHAKSTLSAAGPNLRRAGVT